jgi:small subunit ribosomal protein S9
MEIINTSGRRKTSVARIYMSKGNGSIEVNGRDYKSYFPTPTLQFYVTQSFNVSKTMNEYDVKVNVAGGGITGQAQAIRLAISKALIEINPEFKKDLRADGLITRDPRMVEKKTWTKESS